MSNTATISARTTGARLSDDRLGGIAARFLEGDDSTGGDQVIDLLAPTPAVDISCWRLLNAQVPLTLLLDLALPSSDELAELYDELLDEEASIDWVPTQRVSTER